MSNYTAAGMSTAAANGHRDGYQAGYADAVRAVETGKDASAQEAVAEVGRWHREMNLTAFGKGDEWRAQQMLNCPHGRFATVIETYLAAPVAAAPAMTRDEAIKIARESAVMHRHQHTYLPLTRGYAENWQPHEWVISAIQAAAQASTPAAPGIDPADPWRGLYDPEKMPKLDGVNAYHVAHPDLPSWPKDEDEERGVSPLVKAQGFELEAVFGEYPEDDDADPDYCAWLAQWEPTPPTGEHWRLVCIQDTEDGPAAFYVCPFALIDASPKGGSEAQDAARWRAIAPHLDVDGDSDDSSDWTWWLHIKEDGIVFQRTMTGKGDVEEAADYLVSQMQATRAEVGE